MAEDEELRSLAQELELGKKKKKKKKIALDVVAAEAASLAASGGGGENSAPQPPPSAPQTGGESQTAGATPLGVTEPGMEEDGLELELMGKKKKKKKKIDMSDLEHHTVGLPEPVVAPPPPDPKLEESAIQDLAEKELASAVVDEFMLPKKKKRRRPNITFEGFDVAVLEVEVNVDDEKAREGEGGMENDEDLEPTDTVPWMGTDRDYTYDELLERVFNIMRQKNPSMVGGQKKKLVMKPPQVVRVGAKKTSFVNFTDICKLLHRQPKHLLAFLLAELGTSGSVDGNNQLIIKGKFQQKQIETVLRRYIKEYVTCHTCRSPDTILHKETRLFFLQCETCGSRCSVQSIKSGFQAITKGYRAQMRRMN